MSPRGSVVKPKIVPATVQYVTDINVKSCHRFMVLAGSKIHASGMNFRCITLQAVTEWRSHLPCKLDTQIEYIFKFFKLSDENGSLPQDTWHLVTYGVLLQTPK